MKSSGGAKSVGLAATVGACGLDMGRAARRRAVPSFGSCHGTSYDQRTTHTIRSVPIVRSANGTAALGRRERRATNSYRQVSRRAGSETLPIWRLTVSGMTVWRRVSRRTEGTGLMGADDKIENKGQEVAGKIKKKVGDATDNQSLEAEGWKDEKAGKVKQAGEKIKDVFKD